MPGGAIAKANVLLPFIKSPLAAAFLCITAAVKNWRTQFYYSLGGWISMVSPRTIMLLIALVHHLLHRLIGAKIKAVNRISQSALLVLHSSLTASWSTVHRRRSWFLIVGNLLFASGSSVQSGVAGNCCSSCMICCICCMHGCIKKMGLVVCEFQHALHEWWCWCWWWWCLDNTSSSYRPCLTALSYR